MTFSYLRQKGVLKGVSLLTQMRMSLELNFVNHVLPSGGVSGFSYLNWRLNNLGVSGARATMSQLVRYLASFAGLVTLLAVAVILVTVDGTVNRWIILMSSALVPTRQKERHLPSPFCLSCMNKASALWQPPITVN